MVLLRKAARRLFRPDDGSRDCVLKVRSGRSKLPIIAGGLRMSFLTKLPKERYSRDGFAGFNGQRDFNLGDGKAFAWMSQLAYETDEPEKIKDIFHVWGMTPLGDGILAAEVNSVLPIASTQAVIAVGRGATIVAFAGTDPLVLANWITDFDTRIASAHVAEGIEVAAQSIWRQLQSLLDRPEAAAGKTFVTGHSLGGALAVVTADRIVKSRRGVEAVYTFGMQRPGSNQFAIEYNERIGQRTYRLVHGEDFVPTFPPSEFGFHHVGRYLHCDRGAKFKTEALAADPTSDSPPFIEGISKDLASLLLAPLSTILPVAGRVKLAALMAAGLGSEGMRRDPVGIAIELLPPRLRDHIPDRYIGGF